MVAGSLGSVDVLSGSGTLVADLVQGTVGMPFDPRGLYFVDSSQLLIADSDPSILAGTPAAFTAVTPEPSTFGLLLLGVGAIKAQARYRKHRRSARS